MSHINVIFRFVDFIFRSMHFYVCGLCFYVFQSSAVAVEFILEQFKGPAGLDIDGTPLFKDKAAVNSHWATASRHLSCMQVRHSFDKNKKASTNS